MNKISINISMEMSMEMSRANVLRRKDQKEDLRHQSAEKINNSNNNCPQLLIGVSSVSSVNTLWSAHEVSFDW